MDEEKFDFENLKVYQKTPNTEPRTGNSPLKNIDEIFSQLVLSGTHVQSAPPRKVFFYGEGVGEISSYVAGWMAGKGMDVIILDGANRFNPYRVSSYGRKASIPPEGLLKKIRIARAFTCYQMATLVGERLACLLRQERGTLHPQKLWVILLGPITTFLDEDVPEREVRPLFERSLRKMEELTREGIPFFLFQSSIPFNSKRTFLTKRLFQFSNLAWRIRLEDEGPKMILEKELTVGRGESRLATPRDCVASPFVLRQAHHERTTTD